MQYRYLFRLALSIRGLVAMTGTLGSLAFLMPGSARAAIPTGVTFATFYDTSKVKFFQPTHIGEVPGDANRIVVVERPGTVSILEKSGDTYAKKSWFNVVADTTTHWDGAWSVLFHPKFPAKPLFYFLYRLPSGTRNSVIEEWQVDGAALQNPRKVRTILEFPQKSIHSSGDMRFGPDGYLYTSQADREQNAQDKSQLWGKVSRIDIDNKDTGLEYAIPATNPFRDSSGYRKEIWATGLRVPWRFSFDPKNGDMYLGDVGASTSDELNIIQAGKNYGASVVEGKCNTGNCAPYTDPVWAMTRAEGGCIIGGFVYRGDSTSAFYGAYIFADYQEQWLWGALVNPAKNGVTEKKKLIANNEKTPGRVSVMGQDAMGNIYAGIYIETGSQRNSHIFRLAHAQLKAATTPIIKAVKSMDNRGQALLRKASRAMLPGVTADGRRLFLKGTAP